MDKVAFTIAEVVEITSIGRSRLYQEIRDGRLKICKVGRRTLVPADELSTWLRSLTRSGGDPRPIDSDLDLESES